MIPYAHQTNDLIRTTMKLNVQFKIIFRANLFLEGDINKSYVCIFPARKTCCFKREHGTK